MSTSSLDLDLTLFTRARAAEVILGVYDVSLVDPDAVILVRGELTTALDALQATLAASYLTTCTGQTRAVAVTQLIGARGTLVGPSDPVALALFIAAAMAALDLAYGPERVVAAVVTLQGDTALLHLIVLAADIGLHARRQFDPAYRTPSVKRSEPRTSDHRAPNEIRLPPADAVRASIRVALLCPDVVEAGEHDADEPAQAFLPTGSADTILPGSEASTEAAGLVELASTADRDASRRENEPDEATPAVPHALAQAALLGPYRRVEPDQPFVRNWPPNPRGASSPWEAEHGIDPGRMLSGWCLRSRDHNCLDEAAQPPDRSTLPDTGRERALLPVERRPERGIAPAICGGHRQSQWQQGVAVARTGIREQQDRAHACGTRHGGERQSLADDSLVTASGWFAPIAPDLVEAGHDQAVTCGRARNRDPPRRVGSGRTRRRV